MTGTSLNGAGGTLSVAKSLVNNRQHSRLCRASGDVPAPTRVDERYANSQAATCLYKSSEFILS